MYVREGGGREEKKDKRKGGREEGMCVCVCVCVCVCLLGKQEKVEERGREGGRKGVCQKVRYSQKDTDFIQAFSHIDYFSTYKCHFWFISIDLPQS